MPLEGQIVIVALLSGEEVLAYRANGSWWSGVENSPEDVVLENVVSWRYSE